MQRVFMRCKITTRPNIFVDQKAETKIHLALFRIGSQVDALCKFLNWPSPAAGAMEEFLQDEWRMSGKDPTKVTTKQILLSRSFLSLTPAHLHRY